MPGEIIGWLALLRILREDSHAVAREIFDQPRTMYDKACITTASPSVPGNATGLPPAEDSTTCAGTPTPGATIQPLPENIVQEAPNVLEVNCNKCQAPAELYKLTKVTGSALRIGAINSSLGAAATCCGVFHGRTKQCPSLNARRPSRNPVCKLPRGAVDCHFHVFGPETRFPYAPGRSYTPPDASITDYETLAAKLGYSRAVIVQPSVYGLDSSRTLSFLSESRIPTRAVLVLDPNISERELEALHERGARGVRVNLVFSAGLALEAATILADKIRGLGWHLQFLADLRSLR